MANQEQVTILRKRRGVEHWNKWRLKNVDIAIHLSNADLQSRVLKNADLKNADLKNARLHLANLENANLENANLENASLKNANLEKTNLKNANFKNANIENANLKNANLTSADFTSAKLNSANLENANLYSLNFEKAKLNFANLENTNLENANLKNANLKNVNLKNTNLEKTCLINADLSNALLRVSKALGTSFKGAILTGACIEDWHINSETNFEGVVCDYIYLKWDEKKQESTERRPSDPSRKFAPGEFTKLFQQARETVDLIFSEGIDWQAFLTSYQNVQLASDHGELDIRAIEKSPDGSFVIRVAVPEDTDKADLEAQFYERYEGELKRLDGLYQRELQAKDREIEIYRQQSADMLELAKLAASRPITVEAKAVAGDNIKQSGNFGIGYMGGGEIQSGAKVAGIYNEAEKQNLQTAAHEIQVLLDQLDKDYGNSKTILATEVIRAVDNNSKLKNLLTSLQAGSMAALEQFLNHPAASFVITFLDTWHQEQLNG